MEGRCVLNSEAFGVFCEWLPEHPNRRIVTLRAFICRVPAAKLRCWVSQFKISELQIQHRKLLVQTGQESRSSCP